jgi:predicted MFS family arabinose efflux permease
MPLVSIVVSMSAGVWLLRYMSAIQVVQIGFSACVLCMIWLLVAQGDAWACFALAAALGLVQGASFAAVPQLNPGAADQARANGAMAQMGNIGNTLGTPALAAVGLLGGYQAILVTTIAIMSLGAVLHGVMARYRRRAAPGCLAE